MDREMIDKNVAILELIADFKIAVTQLQEDCKSERTRADIAENNQRCAEIKADRVLIRLKNMLKEGAVVTKEDIQDCIDILENN